MRAWSLKVSSNASYGGNLGYDDDVLRVYQYDSLVQYSRQIRRGDVAVTVVDGEVAGISTVAEIRSRQGEKTLLKCPYCGTTAIARRTTVSPPYRCTRCTAEFDLPREHTRDVEIIRAMLGDTQLLSRLSAPDLHPVELSHGMTAIRPLDPIRLASLVARQAPSYAARLTHTG